MIEFLTYLIVAGFIVAIVAVGLVMMLGAAAGVLSLILAFVPNRQNK